MGAGFLASIIPVLITKGKRYNALVQKTLTIGNQTFELVGVQREQLSAVYRGEGCYLRIGESSKILKDLNFHKQMEKAGFPVAKLLQEGEHDGQTYFIEASLGERRLGLVFADDMKRIGEVEDVHFRELCGVITRHLEAQVTARVPVAWNEFASGIHLDWLVEELPELKEQLHARFKVVQERLCQLPFVVTHGDFNAQNLYGNGVIDLEDSFPAPLGYDVVTILTTVDFTPNESAYEFFSKYTFSEAQRTTLIQSTDETFVRFGVPPLSPYVDEFAFCRAVWMTVRMSEWPKTREWRITELREKYLS